MSDLTADQFNAAHPVGTPVIAYPWVRPNDPVAITYRERAKAGRTYGSPDPCKRLETRTRSVAWTLGCGEPVVMVDGYPGGIALTHIDIVT